MDVSMNTKWMYIVWERLNKSGKWCPYSAEVSQFLEKNFKMNVLNVSLGDVDETLKMYDVDLKDMIQVSQKTGTKSKIRSRFYSNVDSLSNGFTWEWSGNDKDSWNAYDIDVNNAIEKAFQKGVKTVALKKTFKGYNYEIDFTKMIQINKQTKRKRPIRRKQMTSPYPVTQCLDDVAANQSVVNTSEEQEKDSEDEYPELIQEVPGTSALVEQLNNYVRSVTMEPISTKTGDISVPNPPVRKRKKHNKSEDSSNNDVTMPGNSTVISSPHSSSSPNPLITHAIVNGHPWYESWVPHTPSSEIKPVPGIEPLPECSKKVAKKKKKKGNSVQDDGDGDNVFDIFKMYTDEINVEQASEKLLQEVCVICYETVSKKSFYNEDATVVKLKLCSHVFHKACLEAMYNAGPKDQSLQCPFCKTIHGVKCGTQPPGSMVYHVLPYSLPSFPDCDTIRIIYNMWSGTQGPEHPNPGKKYTARGFPRNCYLPDNELGRKVLRLLVKAFQRRLIFTIGRSSTTGEENTVTWNEIHHKTEFGCNRRGHGFPDPNYFDNVLAELDAHGIKDDEVYLWYPA